VTSPMAGSGSVKSRGAASSGAPVREGHEVPPDRKRTLNVTKLVLIAFASVAGRGWALFHSRLSLEEVDTPGLPLQLPPRLIILPSKHPVCHPV
jgi:hypothetical protein